MRPALRHITLLLCAVTAVTAPLRAEAQRPDSAHAGAWSGEARMSVPFSSATRLTMSFVIAPDGAVTGTVGDATLMGARFGVARGAMGRALRIGREYMIEGALSGSLVRSETLHRARVVISLDFRDGAFVGELQTSGTQDGAPDTQAVSATGLVLHRT